MSSSLFCAVSFGIPQNSLHLNLTFPFPDIHAETTDDDDEVLVVIAEKLGELTNYVGGAEHVHRLLPPLELLAAVEESLVREATIKSAEQVAAAGGRAAGSDADA